MNRELRDLVVPFVLLVLSAVLIYGRWPSPRPEAVGSGVLIALTVVLGDRFVRGWCDRAAGKGGPE